MEVWTRQRGCGLATADTQEVWIKTALRVETSASLWQTLGCFETSFIKMENQNNPQKISDKIKHAIRSGKKDCSEELEHKGIKLESTSWK